MNKVAYTMLGFAVLFCGVYIVLLQIIFNVIIIIIILALNLGWVRNLPFGAQGWLS